MLNVAFLIKATSNIFVFNGFGVNSFVYKLNNP
jgi:hypothetical protein